MNLMPQQDRRRIRLGDHVLQKTLLVALVIMETVVVAIAIWALHKALGEIIDENMYRVHFAGNDKMLTLLISEGMRVLAGMMLVNFVALLVADRIWAYYVYGILRDLGIMMTASTRFSFSAPSPIWFHHAVLDQALAWRASEAMQLVRVRDQIRQLPAQLPALTQDKDAVASALAYLQDG